MTKERLMHLVSRLVLVGGFLFTAAGLPACTGDDVDSEVEDEDVVEIESAIGPDGTNNYPPFAVDSDPLMRSVTDAFDITTPSNPDPRALCAAGTVTSTGCTLRQEWKSWMDADAVNRVPTMTAIAKCAVEASFTIQSPGRTFAGQWGVYPSWKNNRLDGQDKRERISSCMLSLLNGNDVELDLCIIGPGGAPFSDGCGDPAFDTREGGFFGDLFAATPTAYVAGPDTADPVDSGRACFGSRDIYCCAEQDTNCAHRIVLAGAILGSPEQGFANKRCNGQLVSSGGNSYCTSFYSTREPGRSYTNVFTTFIPSAP